MRMIVVGAVVLCAAAQAPQGIVSFDRIQHAAADPSNWLTYSGTLNGQRHSRLDQITRENVASLKLAWIWQARTPEHNIEATPLVVDRVLYTVLPQNVVVALDATSGRPLWTFTYSLTVPLALPAHNRGLAILGDRLFLGTLDGHLVAIDATTGKAVWDVAVVRSSDVHCQQPETFPSTCYPITMAPLVVKNKVLVGISGGDSEPGFGIRGFIAAFDSATGKEAWRFWTVPSATEPGGQTWAGESWRFGGAGVFVTGTYDPNLNLTYWGTGNPAPSSRPDLRAGANLYSDSIVALDADTGALKWHDQLTPHDEKDLDAAQVPVLAEILWQGRERKVLLQANKNGTFYVLDRQTGERLREARLVPENSLWGINWYPPSFSPEIRLFYSPGNLLRAIDPVTGSVRWEFKADQGRTLSGGVLTTASGLVFTGDSNWNVYALNSASGQLLWKSSLGGGVWSPPITFEVDGRQYLAVTAGHSVFAFALDRRGDNGPTEGARDD